MCMSRRYPMKVLHTQGVMHTHPAWLGRQGVSTSMALRQRVQQCLRLLQVRGVKALREPVVDPCQQLTGVFTLPLTRPYPTETERHAQLQRLRLLAVGDLERLTPTGVRLGDLWARTAAAARRP